jgi:hypothetical protein
MTVRDASSQGSVKGNHEVWAGSDVTSSREQITMMQLRMYFVSAAQNAR